MTTTNPKDRIDSVIPELSGISQNLYVLSAQLMRDPDRTSNESTIGDALSSIAAHIERITNELDDLCSKEM